MAVTFDRRHDVEQNLRRECGDFDLAAKEAAMVELYRQARINQSELSHALGISRLKSEALLKKHNVTEDLLTDADYEQALARLRSVQPR